MKKIFLALIFLLIPIVSITTIAARRGCCSHHKGVCGCNCCDGSPLSDKCAPYYPNCNSAPSYTSTLPKITTEPSYVVKPITIATVKSIPLMGNALNAVPKKIPHCSDFGTYSSSLDKCVCNEGYRMDAMERNCLKNRVAPINGSLTRNSFSCDNGYKKEFDKCVEIIVPIKIDPVIIHKKIEPIPKPIEKVEVIPVEKPIAPIEEKIENFFDEVIEAQPISQEAQKILQSVVEEAIESTPEKSIWQEIMSWFSFSL